MRSLVSQAAPENKQLEGFRPIEGLLPNSSVPASVSANWTFIARQAICNRNNQVFGYELLARSGWENRFMEDSDSPSRRMIVEGVMHGFDGLTQGRHGFINCTRESLVEGLVTLLPKSTVVELLETVSPDHKVIAACTEIHRQGYQLALDDFRIMPGMEALVDLASYIKIDFRLSDKEERREIVSYLRGCKAKLIAEKVETEA